jgi:hypothetical protein
MSDVTKLSGIAPSNVSSRTSSFEIFLPVCFLRQYPGEPAVSAGKARPFE